MAEHSGPATHRASQCSSQAVKGLPPRPGSAMHASSKKRHKSMAQGHVQHKRHMPCHGARPGWQQYHPGHVLLSPMHPSRASPLTHITDQAHTKMSKPKSAAVLGAGHGEYTRPGPARRPQRRLCPQRANPQCGAGTNAGAEPTHRHADGMHMCWEAKKHRESKGNSTQREVAACVATRAGRQLRGHASVQHAIG